MKRDTHFEEQQIEKSFRSDHGYTLQYLAENS